MSAQNLSTAKGLGMIDTDLGPKWAEVFRGLARGAAAPLVLALQLGGTAACAATIDIIEAVYDAGERTCPATAYFAERCYGREACTIELGRDLEPCIVVDQMGPVDVRVRYQCDNNYYNVHVVVPGSLSLACTDVSFQPLRAKDLAAPSR